MVQCALDGKGNPPVPTASLDLDLTKTKPLQSTGVHLVYLLTAGIFEVAFTLCLKLSEGFTKVVWTIGFVVFAVISFSLLNLAIEGIALGTAYAIWTGIGAAGTAIVGIVAFKEPANVARIVLIVALIGAIVGLKMVSA